MSDEVPKCRVLVVEDEALVGMEIGGSIEWQGHEVVGPIAVLDEALAVLANVNLDCAILDINIRGGQSYPVADILLQRGVPVLLLTGYNKLTLPERLQGEALLHKPFTAEQLDEEISKLCARAAKSGR